MPTLGVAASLACHGLLAIFLIRLPAPSDALSGPRFIHVDAFAPIAPGENALEDGATGTRRSAIAEELVLGGRRSQENIDARDRGAGGERFGAMEVSLLLERDERVLLQDTPMNAAGVSQAQRIQTARDRATRENRRATPNPADAVFLASGAGAHPERRRVAVVDPRVGAPRAPEATVTGGAPVPEGQAGAVAEPRNDAPGEEADGAVAAGATSAVRQGREESSPGRGIANGRGQRESDAARVAHDRPAIDPGPAATPSATTTGPIRDDTNSELLAARLVQSLVESTPRRGQEAGAGAGGLDAPGAPGSGGGAGQGGRASVHGPGDGRRGALDTSDARYQRWYLAQRRKVANRLTFPHARAVALDQGLAVYRVRVRRNGALVGSPRLLRSSGFTDLDAAARRAIEQSAPFDPLPAQLAPDQDPFGLRMTVTFRNPMVR